MDKKEYYKKEQPSDELLVRMRAHYDAEVTTVDHAFGELMTELEKRSLLDSTIVVVVSDHGEEFFEHGWWEHSASLYEEVIRVPLLVSVPGEPGKVETQPVEMRDLMRTLTEINLGERSPGYNLFNPPKDRLLRSFLKVGEDAQSYRSLVGLDPILVEMEAVYWGREKLIQTRAHLNPERAPFEFYSLAQDPGENQDRADEGQLGFFQTFLRGYSSALKVDVDEEIVKERLKTLQYL